MITIKLETVGKISIKKLVDRLLLRKLAFESKIEKMAAKDIFHEAVKRALEKDQWIITKDPLKLEWEEVLVKIDLGAERLIAANKGNEKIAVEIKRFVSISAISSFNTALGQFLNYLIMLEVNEPERLLYLAVPIEAYQTFFQSR